MGNSVKIFSSEEFGKVRTLVNEQSEPLFCLVDVCEVLGLGVQGVSRRMDDGVISTLPIPDALGRVQSTMFVTEDGLYDVIFDSRKAAARKFRKWVTSEVIPSIRKTGRYEVSSVPREDNKQLSMELLFAEKASAILRLSEVSKLSMMRTISSKYDMPDMLPHYVEAEDAALSATELLKKYAPEVSVKAFNERLVECGLLCNLSHTKKNGKVQHFRSVTDDGLAWGQNFMDSHSSGTTQPKWYESRFVALCQSVGLLSNSNSEASC